MTDVLQASSLDKGLTQRAHAVLPRHADQECSIIILQNIQLKKPTDFIIFFLYIPAAEPRNPDNKR